MERIILHVDANNAFLSWTAVWMLKNGYDKDIRNRYAIIGGDESLRKGIVLSFVKLRMEILLFCLREMQQL